MHLKRTGWPKRQVNQPESDAEHSYSLAMLALLLMPEELDRLRCLELALTHDLAEIYAGDYIPTDNVTPEDKHQQERSGILKLADELNWPQLIELFDEFESQKTKESIYIKALDKLDNVITARYYDDNHRAPDKLMSEFSSHAEKCIDAFSGEDIKQIKYILQSLKD